jgi:hypothetical protein
VGISEPNFAVTNVSEPETLFLFFIFIFHTIFILFFLHVSTFAKSEQRNTFIDNLKYFCWIFGLLKTFADKSSLLPSSSSPPVLFKGTSPGPNAPTENLK